MMEYFEYVSGTLDYILQDAKNKNVEHILILSGDHLYRMDYMDFVQVKIAISHLRLQLVPYLVL